MAIPGYYRFPTIFHDTIVFGCEDDLWTVSAQGGIARRLTANLGPVELPALSPQGGLLAFTGREEGGPEVYVMPAVGGPATRLTYLGSSVRVVGWSPDGEDVLFASDVGSPFVRQFHLYAISHRGGEPRRLPTGSAVTISMAPGGGRVIGRNAMEIAWWKRYRGGTAGDLWIDEHGQGAWRRLIKLGGNLTRPMWVQDRIYFLSDHEGIGNLYSCTPAGQDLCRHTHNEEYYVRSPASDGQSIVYSAGSDIFVFDVAAGESRLIPIDICSPRVQRNRRFVDAAKYLQSYDIHPKGHSVALVSRGQSFTMAHWEGAVVRYGAPVTRHAGPARADTSSEFENVAALPVAVRHRLTAWLHDGERLVTVSDAEGEESLEVYRVEHEFDPARDAAPAERVPRRLAGLDLGRPISLLASPTRPQVAVCNHRNELLLVDIDEGSAIVLDRSRYARLSGVAWSPDGNWLAYGFPNSLQTSLIKLCKIATGTTWEVTRTVLRDEAPAFDPDGKYLYFLSSRTFDPVYDNLQFDLNFPRGMRPYLVTLRADIPSPFVPKPRAPGSEPGKSDKSDKNGKNDRNAGDKDSDKEQQGDSDKDSAAKVDELHIDVDGIADRVLALPVEEGLYREIAPLPGKVLYVCWPIQGSLHQSWAPQAEPASQGVLKAYDLGEQREETLVDGITSFQVSMDAKTLIYRKGNRLRVLKAGDKPNKDAGNGASRKSGWLDLGRLKVSVMPGAEWAQMYRHAWRLQRDHFWAEDMSGVDWQRVFWRYWALLDRVATRSEFSDLMWEMQGELGTSHAYEFGGDYRPEPDYHQGFLGAEFTYDEEEHEYRITRIVRGDSWDESASSPLARPGLGIHEGDRLLAIDSLRLSREVAPGRLLVNRAGDSVLVTVASRDGGAPRTVAIKTLRSERGARYREWVERNRRRVHEATDGRIGYVHIPDMGAPGYAEFHRGYLAEVTRQGLIVDVRYNGGGHVSQLILEKLARRVIGYDVPRWGQPMTYPSHTVVGPMVALTNERAGSDGDIFSHAFKLMKLGPLIGTRTWGGVIGIWPREFLIDGGVTTQPEFSSWFSDVGWALENYGTEPDIEVELTPADEVVGRDPQMERALEEALRMLSENPPKLPDFTSRPQLGLPRLPRT